MLLEGLQRCFHLVISHKHHLLIRWTSQAFKVCKSILKCSVPPSVPRVENRGAFADNLRFPRDRFAIAGLTRGSG